MKTSYVHSLINSKAAFQKKNNSSYYLYLLDTYPKWQVRRSVFITYIKEQLNN
jgi:hypothetical protein